MKSRTYNTLVTVGLLGDYRITTGTLWKFDQEGKPYGWRGIWVPSRVLQLFPINLRVSFIILFIYYYFHQKFISLENQMPSIRVLCFSKKISRKFSYSYSVFTLLFSLEIYFTRKPNAFYTGTMFFKKNFQKIFIQIQ